MSAQWATVDDDRQHLAETASDPTGGPAPRAASNLLWWLGVACVALVAIVALIVAIVALTRDNDGGADATATPSCGCCDQCDGSNPPSCGCCARCSATPPPPRHCRGQTNFAVQRVYLDVLNRYNSGNSIADPTAAVGNKFRGGRIVAAINNAVAIIHKQSGDVLSREISFGGIHDGDPWVTFDPVAERFFYTTYTRIACAHGLTIVSPLANAQMCVGVAFFGPQTFDVTAPVTVTNATDGCTSIVTNLTGQIALIVRGSCSFVIKVKNAQNAGAIGVIIYNQALNSTINMAGTDPTIVIPSVFVGNDNGRIIINNLPVVARIVGPATTTLSTVMHISVSKDAAPNTSADFYHYNVQGSSIYASSFADYPKNAVSPTQLIISSQGYGDIVPGQPDWAQCIGPQIVALDKNALVNGVGAHVVWEKAFSGTGDTQPQWLWPARNNWHTSDTHPELNYFVGVDRFIQCTTNNTPQATGLVIHVADEDGVLPQSVFLPFPTPMSFGSIVGGRDYPNARQPLPAIPLGLESNNGFAFQSVVFKNHLYTVVIHNISDVHLIARVFDIDISDLFDHGVATLYDWFDVNGGSDLDITFAAVDVDQYGNVACSFSVSGPNQYVSSGYTVHLATDPLHTAHYPLHIGVPNNYTYYRNVGGNNRWDDFTSIYLDPVDGETFYAYNQRPMPDGFFSPPGIFGPCDKELYTCVAQAHTTDVFAFRVQQDACPEDGGATTPMTFDTSNAVIAPSFKNNPKSADLATQSLSYDENDVDDDDVVAVAVA